MSNSRIYTLELEKLFSIEDEIDDILESFEQDDRIHTIDFEYSMYEVEDRVEFFDIDGNSLSMIGVQHVEFRQGVFYTKEAVLALKEEIQSSMPELKAKLLTALKKELGDA